MFKMFTLKEEKKELLGLGLGCWVLPGPRFSCLCSQSKVWRSSSTDGAIVWKNHSFCLTHVRGKITAEESTRALEMVIRKMPCASIWTHPESLWTFHWKRMPSLPSILTRLWAGEALLKHLTLLLISISWRDDLVSVTLIGGVEGKVCLCYLPPPLFSPLDTILPVSGQPGAWIHLKNICGDVVRYF